jgi:alkylation response protein AidB-like acyl-CoA dehydrogenase
VQTCIIATYAPEVIKQHILPGMCSGEHILAVCMREPDAGTDVANYRSNTDIKSDRLILNGVKTPDQLRRRGDHVRVALPSRSDAGGAKASAACWSKAIRRSSRSPAATTPWGYGVTDEFAASRLYRGSRYRSLGGGTFETLRDLIGKGLMADVSNTDGIFGFLDA